MHPDPCFHSENRERCRTLVEQVGFAMIFAATPDGPRVVHAPVVWADSDLLQFHIARRNLIVPHLSGATALCVVNGADAYVSPRWYSDRAQVPTWNYVAVELEGPVRTLDEQALRAQIATLISTSEARVPGADAWTLDEAPASDVDAMVREIVGFELAVQAWRPTFKLSQNKPAAERERVAQHLDAAGGHAIAQLMRTVPA
jgi:transcriptional regulator